MRLTISKKNHILGKLLVTTGEQKITKLVATSEIIDLSKEICHVSCSQDVLRKTNFLASEIFFQDLPPFPSTTIGSTGGLLNKNNPIVKFMCPSAELA